MPIAESSATHARTLLATLLLVVAGSAAVGARAAGPAGIEGPVLWNSVDPGLEEQLALSLRGSAWARRSRAGTSASRWWT
jgi:hypothetical protein